MKVFPGKIVRLRFWPVVFVESKGLEKHAVAGYEFYTFRIRKDRTLDVFVLFTKTPKNTPKAVAGIKATGKPSPALAVTTVVGIVAGAIGLGLTLALFREAKDLTGIFYSGFALAGYLAWKRK